MNTIQRIIKNVGVLFISQIFNYLLGFFTVMYTAQYLGAEGFGILSLGLSITTIFGIVVDMGLNTLTVREIARNKSLINKYIYNITLIKLILSILTFGLIYLTVNLIGYNSTVSNVIYTIAIYTIIYSFVGLLNAIFQANEKMEYVSINTIINSVLMFLGTLIGIYYGFTIQYFASLYVISSILVFIYISIMYLRNFSLPKIEIDLNFWKSSLNEAWPFGITTLSATLYTYIDSIMLSIMNGNEVVGWYSAAYKLMLITLIIPMTINVAIFPVMSKFFKSSRESLTLLYERYFRYMIIIGVPMGFGTTILADKIILLIFGQGYTQSITALQILIWTMVITFAGASYIQLLQAINKQLIITKISLSCVIINIVLNLILIPKFSFIGASFATLITEIFLVVFIILSTHRSGYGIKIKMVIKYLFKVLFASIIMSIFLLYFNSLNLFLLMFMGSLVYVAVLYKIRGIDEVDKNLIKQMINSIKSF